MPDPQTTELSEYGEKFMREELERRTKTTPLTERENALIGLLSMFWRRADRAEEKLRLISQPLERCSTRDGFLWEAEWRRNTAEKGLPS